MGLTQTALRILDDLNHHMMDLRGIKMLVNGTHVLPEIQVLKYSAIFRCPSPRVHYSLLHSPR